MGKSLKWEIHSFQALYPIKQPSFTARLLQHVAKKKDAMRLAHFWFTTLLSLTDDMAQGNSTSESSKVCRRNFFFAHLQTLITSSIQHVGHEGVQVMFIGRRPPELVVAVLVRSFLLVELILLNGRLVRRNARAFGRVSADQPACAEVREHSFDGLLVVLLIVKIVKTALSSWLVDRLLSGMLKLLVPGLLDVADLLLAEVEPALEFGSLFNALLVHRLLFIWAVLLVERLLSDVLEFEGDLWNLAQVHAARRFAWRVVEVVVGFQLFLHKALHCLQILLVEDLTDQIQDQEALLVGDGAKLVCAHHVEHRLYHLFAQGVV